MRDTAAGRCGQHVAASTFAGTKGSFPAGETDVRRPDMEYGGERFRKAGPLHVLKCRYRPRHCKRMRHHSRRFGLFRGYGKEVRKLES